MDPAMQKTIQYLTEVETLAQDILTEKNTKLDLSNAVNKYNEAIRALEKTDSRKTWLNVGDVYLELGVEECRNMLLNEKQTTQNEVDRLYDSIKDKVGKLRDLEHQPGIEGFKLKPMTGAEAKMIHKALGFPNI